MASDSTAFATAAGWQSRCLHCKTPVGVGNDGEPWLGTTLEHIVPRSWFAKRALRQHIAFADPDDLRNLALACARCNHAKGRTIDIAGMHDERAMAVVQRLLAARAERLVQPSPH